LAWGVRIAGKKEKIPFLEKKKVALKFGIEIHKEVAQRRLWLKAVRGAWKEEKGKIALLFASKSSSRRLGAQGAIQLLKSLLQFIDSRLKEISLHCRKRFASAVSLKKKKTR